MTGSRTIDPSRQPELFERRRLLHFLDHVHTVVVAAWHTGVVVEWLTAVVRLPISSATPERSAHCTLPSLGTNAHQTRLNRREPWPSVLVT
jgi:hypothetical protein